jgi:type IV pilus biogenesis/stability protein PilW
MSRLVLLVALATGCLGAKRQAKASARVDLGTAYLAEGQPERAIETLQQAVKLDHRNWEAWEKLGLAYMARNAQGLADRAFQKALRLVPEQGEVNNNYGLLLLSAGRLDEAIPRFEAAAADLTYRKTALALSNLGYALHLAGRDEDALVRLDEAVQRAPHLCPARFHRGLAREAAGRTEGALEDFEGVIQLCGDEATGAYYHAARVLFTDGDRDAACAYLDAASAGAADTPLGKAAGELRGKECL